MAFQAFEDTMKGMRHQSDEIGEDTIRDRENAARLARVDNRKSNNYGLERESTVTVSIPKLPTGLPRFKKSNNWINNPEEFLRQYKIVMIAEDFPEERWIKVLPKQLDLADGKWLERWLREQVENYEITWLDFEKTFLKQFLHADYQALLIQQWLALKMEGNAMDSVSKYNEQFINLAERLDIELDSTFAIHQYKAGLIRWLVEQLATNEVAADMTDKKVTVPFLMQAVLKQWQNKKMKLNSTEYVGLNISINSQKTPQSQISKQNYGGIKFGLRCNFCQRKGHRAENCWDNPKNNSNKNAQKNSFVANKIYTKTNNIIACCHCGQSGHITPNCPKRNLNQQQAKTTAPQHQPVRTARKTAVDQGVELMEDKDKDVSPGRRACRVGFDNQWQMATNTTEEQDTWIEDMYPTQDGGQIEQDTVYFNDPEGQTSGLQQSPHCLQNYAPSCR